MMLGMKKIRTIRIFTWSNTPETWRRNRFHHNWFRRWPTENRQDSNGKRVSTQRSRNMARSFSYLRYRILTESLQSTKRSPIKILLLKNSKHSPTLTSMNLQRLQKHCSTMPEHGNRRQEINAWRLLETIQRAGWWLSTIRNWLSNSGFSLTPLGAWEGYTWSKIRDPSQATEHNHPTSRHTISLPIVSIKSRTAIFSQPFQETYPNKKSLVKKHISFPISLLSWTMEKTRTTEKLRRYF